MFASSAKWWTLQYLIARFRSLIYKKNSKGPKTDLCADLSMKPANHYRAGRHAGKSIWQHNWSHKQHNKFYQKSCKLKFPFFSRLKRDLFFNFFVSQEKIYQVNIPFKKTIHIYVFIKGIIGKMNCYCHMRFFFNLY